MIIIDQTQILIGILFLSVFVEGLIKYLFDVLTGVEDDTSTIPNPRIVKFKPYTHFVSLLLGVVLAFAYKIDIPAALFGLTAMNSVFGYIISGVIIGRGSNYANDFISKIRASTKLSTQVTTESVASTKD